MTELKDKPEISKEEEQAFRIASLIAGYINHKITPEEFNELDQWACENEKNMALFEELTNASNLNSALNWMNGVNTKTKLHELSQELKFKGTSWRKGLIASLYKYGSAAAIVIFVLGSAIFWFTRHKKTIPPISQIEIPKTPDLLPGRDQAILTLSNGKKVVLDLAKDGTLLAEGNTEITKKNGQLHYTIKGNSGDDEERYNTLSTPRGGNYTLTLADGTNVWLNASSSISYPIGYSGNDRKVAVTGEAYFEVASKTRPSKLNPNISEKVPFSVESKNKGAIVEVLGTHFNINDYDDEPVSKTTLLEGKVKITAGGKSSFLKPGQQAEVNNLNEINMASGVDLAKVVAWKDGYFNFSGEDLKTIMKQVSRWYDVDIQFDKAVKNTGYYFILSKKLPVSKLFNVLETTGGAHFIIEGRTIKVLP
jgi:transmembrane sensor